MSSINSLTGPRVQTFGTQAQAQTSRAGFGSLIQQNPAGGSMSAAYRPGDQTMTSGGQVVSSALASVGASSGNGILNSYLSAVGRAPINEGGTQGAAGQPAAGSQAEQEQKVVMELAELSAATLSNSILHMGNRMKVSLETE
ncbi:hypothetical protein LZ198_40630 [Myxococcus sp. K15C18031901]|uniref:hypothetical protein n=1 Tax=Myxococcus dinghuensis TaxID=2906761 RepID=UPI0020A806AE|nr:hypothetical protein [Myxococcus dinghuensis]MCP3105194.1 hypothetical protein [Myxococcus dinghuensis]